MMKIVFTPNWFLANDVLIEVFSFIILLIFFILAFRSYKISKKKSVFYLGLGFLSIAFGELSTVLTKLVLYYHTSVTREIGNLIITYQIVNTVDIFYYIGFFFQRFLILAGLYIIYKIPYEKRKSSDFWLILYLLFIVALLSQNIYYLYYLTAFILLLLIIKHYYNIYKKHRLVNTKILLLAFSLLAINQIVFLFSEINYIYVTAESIQLVSYIIMLVLAIRITKWKEKGTE